MSPVAENANNDNEFHARHYAGVTVESSNVDVTNNTFDGGSTSTYGITFYDFTGGAWDVAISGGLALTAMSGTQAIQVTSANFRPDA